MIWVDASVWLEVALNQERAEECVRFLENSQEEELFTGDFDVYSIILTLLKYKKLTEDIRTFLGVLQGFHQLTIFRPNAEVLVQATLLMNEEKLTFDDALAYASMRHLETRKIATLDRDFKKLDVDLVI